MFKITIPENSSSNCFDCVIYSLLKYFGFDYKAYNIKYFYTDYFDSSLNDSNYYLRRGESCEKILILKDIYNIDLIITKKNKDIDLFEIINNTIKNKPIAVTIDPYYCYWSPFYNKTHNYHVILIVDIDYEEKKYICFDVHFNTVGYVKIDFDIINNNFKCYYIFNFNSQNEIKLDAMIKIINLPLNIFDRDLDLKKSEMINCLTMNESKLISPDYLETSMSLINLMWIAEDKKHFSIFLKYIEKKIEKPVFSSIYKLLSSSEKSFLLAKSILTKYAITGRLKENELRSIIDQIIDIDALTVDQIINVFKEIDYKC